MGVALLCCSACKKERKTNDIITKIAPKPKTPRNPQSLSDFKYEKKVQWMGSVYTIRIRRFADKSLETTTDEDGKKYYDIRYSCRFCARMVRLSMIKHSQKPTSEPLLTINMGVKELS